MQIISPLYSGGGQVYVPDSNIKSSRELLAQYDSALKQATTLISQANALSKDYESFDKVTKSKLDSMIPSSIDPIMYTDELAELVKNSDSKIDASFGERMVPSGTYADLGAFEVGFKVEGTYEDFKKALILIESSLRLYDIESIKFSAPDPEKDGSLSTMNVSAKTYILK